MKLRSVLRGCELVALVICVISSAHAQIAIPGPSLGLNGIVFAVEPLASGKFVLGGTFNSFNGDLSSGLGLIRLTSSATKDPAWDIGFVNNVRDTLVIGNFLYVSGEFTTVRTLSAGTLSQPYLFRMNLSGLNDGKIDTTWAPNVSGPVYHLETDGTSLFIAGNFTTVNSTARNNLAKITIGDSLHPFAVDASWNPSPNGDVSALKFAGAKLYVGGGFGNIGGGTNHYIARLSTTGTGTADTAWNPVCNLPVSSLESDATYIYLGGKFSTINSVTTRRGLCRLQLAGGAAMLDATWNPNCDGEVTTLLKSGTSLFIAGVFQNVSSQPRYFLAKVPDSGTGAADSSFIPNPNGAILDMKISGGSLLCGGRFSTTVGASSAAFAKLDTTTGAASAGFTGRITTIGNLYSMLPVTGGKMMIGGIFDSVNGVARRGLARLNSDGSVDTSFQVDLFGYNPVVNDMKVDGSFLYIAGDFFKAGGVAVTHVARVNTGTGAVDGTWNPHPYTPVKCLETDGTYTYIGGGGLLNVGIGTNSSTVQVFNLARITKSTPPVIDTTWTPVIGGIPSGDPAVGDVEDMIFNGANLIIGGSFAFIVNPSNPGEFYQRVRLASLTTTTWGPPIAGYSTTFDNTVRRLLLFNGSLYVGGDFFYLNSTYQGCVAKINPADGSWDTAFVGVDPIQSGSLTTSGANFSMFATNGSYLYVGGNFDYVWGGSAYNYSPYIVRVNPTNGIYDASWSPYPDGPVNVLAFQGNDLWIWGLYQFIGDQSMSDVVILRPTGTNYQTWANTFFSPAQRTNSYYISPVWDLDGDNLANLYEFAFFMNPLSAAPQNMTAGTGTNGLPLIRQETISGSRYLTMEFTQWKSSTGAGLIYTPQFSSNLATGFAARGVLLSTTSISGDANRERVKYRDSIANLPAAFGKVDVAPGP
jgi:hypothetical protein